MLKPTLNHSLDIWLDYLTQLHPVTIDLSLERIQPLAEALKLTQFPAVVITVGGTNGKGSCVRFLECIYSAAGFRVAAYTSPHLLRFNERLRIDGEELNDEVWIKAFNTLEQHRNELALTFFEFTTLAALLICQELKPDVIILEVGLGGRLDAVNVVNSDLALISAIDFDHMDYLGDTRAAIGLEKAGIFKPRKLAVCGDTDIPLSVFDQAEQQGTTLYCLNRDFFYQEHEENWTWTGKSHSYFHLAFPQLKVQNAATSLMAVELLQNLLPVKEKAIIQGLEQASLPGRFECVNTPVATVYLDVAHNPQAVKFLAENIEALDVEEGTKTLAVFSMLKDKDIQACIELMRPLIDEWFVAPLETDRAVSPAEIVKLVGKSCYTFASVSKALEAALERCVLPDRIIVFGSFYTVAGAKQVLAEFQEVEVHKIKQRFRVTPQIKHRLIGLLVLLGLVALFLPLLFSTPQPADRIELLGRHTPDAPPMPEVKMELSEPEASPLPEANDELANSNTTALVPELSSNSSLSSPAAATPASSSPATTPAPATAMAVVNAKALTETDATVTTPSAMPSSTGGSVVVESPKPIELKKNLNQTASQVLSDAPEAWSVQLGSYANPSAAQLLVKRLRARGFEAYTRSATLSNGKQVTRVFVGPEVNQDKVKQVQQQLTREFNLVGVIRKYTVN